jgi:preprotein translocase subunit YajC
MEIGNSVRVKQGIMSPDMEDLSISGWEGRVFEIEDDLITIELDSLTLSKMPEEYIIDSLM